MVCHTQCETGPQTPEHVLQSSLLSVYKEARRQHWPLAEKPKNSKEDRLQTTKFISAIKLDALGQPSNDDDDNEEEKLMSLVN